MAMAALANLTREERIGVVIAALAHVALVAGLMWQVRDEPTPLPTPERMTVSLADEVSLTSTSPDPSAEEQAAVAPVLAPVPEPMVEPEPARPVPKPSAVPKPAPSPKPAPKPTAKPAPPKPTPPKQATGTRLGDDFLKGVGGSERSNNPGKPAAQFGAAEQASLEQAINRELRAPWQRNVPSGVDADKLVTILSWELNPDGSLKGTPRVVSQSGITDSNRPQAALHAERAIRAVQLAAPFDLPPEFYDKWKRIRSWRFDWRLSS